MTVITTYGNGKPSNRSAVTDTYDYDAFGNQITHTGTTPNNYLYRGEQWDPDLGLYYLRARYYDPAIDRFISEDPIGLAGGVNIYAYAYDDPTDFFDPFGLKPKDPGPPCGGLGVDCPPPPPQKPGPSRSHCLGQALWNNGLADALDLTSMVVDVVDPEAQYVKLAWGLGLATAQTINSAAHTDYPGLGLGMTSYLKAPLDLAATSEGWGLAKWIPGFLVVTDVYSTYHDFSHTVSDYNTCMGN